MSDKECHEGITRDGQFQPCDRPAVGYRLDPEDREPYPVCKKHLRPPYWLTARDELGVGSAEHAEAALNEATTKLAWVGRRGTVARPGGSITAAVDARLAYDANHNLAGVWIDAENKLTDLQFLTYQQMYQQRARKLR